MTSARTIGSVGKSLRIVRGPKMLARIVLAALSLLGTATLSAADPVLSVRLDFTGTFRFDGRDTPPATDRHTFELDPRMAFGMIPSEQLVLEDDLETRHPRISDPVSKPAAPVVNAPSSHPVMAPPPSEILSYRESTALAAWVKRDTGAEFGLADTERAIARAPVTLSRPTPSRSQAQDIQARNNQARQSDDRRTLGVTPAKPARRATDARSPVPPFRGARAHQAKPPHALEIQPAKPVRPAGFRVEADLLNAELPPPARHVTRLVTAFQPAPRQDTKPRLTVAAKPQHPPLPIASPARGKSAKPRRPAAKPVVAARRTRQSRRGRSRVARKKNTAPTTSSYGAGSPSSRPGWANSAFQPN